MNQGLELGLILLGVAALFVAALAIAATVGSSRVSHLERSRQYLRPEDVSPLTEAQERQIAQRISDGLVEDFDVVRDEFGDEHIVPTKASPPPAAGGGSHPAS